MFRQWVDETLIETESEMAAAATLLDKIERAFEIWAVQPFELVTTSPDARELVECTFGFAQSAQREGYARFEATIAPILEQLLDRLAPSRRLGPEVVAHILSSAVQGFKQAATTSDELRRLIRQLSILCLGDIAAAS